MDFLMGAIRRESLMEVAKRSGYHYQTIAKMSLNGGNPKLDTLIDLAKTVGFELELVPLDRRWRAPYSMDKSEEGTPSNERH